MPLKISTNHWSQKWSQLWRKDICKACNVRVGTGNSHLYIGYREITFSLEILFILIQKKKFTSTKCCLWLLARKSSPGRNIPFLSSIKWHRWEITTFNKAVLCSQPPRLSKPFWLVTILKFHQQRSWLLTDTLQHRESDWQDSPPQPHTEAWLLWDQPSHYTENKENDIVL